MICLILAAGYATRLYPLTENFPKPLLDVQGRAKTNLGCECQGVFSLIGYRLETKTHRKLKICAQSGYKYQAVPAIRLQGKWLEQLGFSVGQEINVQCQKGCLIIRLEDKPSDAR